MAAFVCAVAPNSTESAIANGDTRTLTLSNQHTDESGAFTYMVNGSYDMAVLDKLNWFLRDWRLNEQIKMDPKLFDILWEVYRESGSAQPIDVLSAYRSPSTNAMLRRRSRQVAEHSQHMEGRAIDAHFLDVGTSTIRDITMRMQAGGVGFYPVGITPWVHIDSGSVRYWPRMSRDSLTRLFPDGKTVFIPADGQPMPGYDRAVAEIEARGGNVVPTGSSGGGLFAWLFGGPHGGGADDAEESGDTSMIASSTSHGRSGGLATVGVAFADAKPSSPRSGSVAEPASAPAKPTVPAKPAEIADVDSQSPVAPGSEVTLRGPIAAEFIAPLPPRKPQELLELAFAAAPLPPSRPLEFALVAANSKPAEPAPATFAVASANSKPVDLPPRPPEFVVQPTSPTASQGNRDMILALLKRGQLPGVITHGMREPPREALALAETGAPEAPDRREMIARAAALIAPLPPARPAKFGAREAEETTRAVRAMPPVRPKIIGANPFGNLTVQAFGDDPQAATAAERLKAAAD